MFPEHSRTFEFEIAGPHRLLANKQHAGFVIQLRAEFLVPITPDRNRTIGERGVIFVRAVSGSDRFAHVGRSGERMGQGARIDKDNSVAAIC